MAKTYKISLANASFDFTEAKNLKNCIESGMVTYKGKYVKKFEQLFGRYINSKNCLSVSNGTNAIELALRTIGIKKNDKVIVPNFTFAAVINAVLLVGAIPLIVDVDRETWTIDIDAIKKNINKNVRAIIAVHTYGQPCKIDEIKKLVKNKNIKIIEDCAEAMGARYKNKKIGNFSDFNTFSFYANKAITTGEGGMIVFKSKKHAILAEGLRNQGRFKRIDYKNKVVGTNFRMSNLQAAVGVAQLKKINIFLKKRKRIFELYDKFFQNIKNISLLPKNSWSQNSYWLYTILLNNYGEKKRDKIIKSLQNVGIETRPGFYPLCKMNPYKKFAKGNYKNSNYIAYNTFSIPTHVDLTFSDQKYIVNQIKKLL